MIVRVRTSWYLSTLVGRLTTALAAAVIVLGIAGGTIYALVVALDAQHQSQAICGLAGDVAKTPTSDITPPIGPTGLSFIRDARNAYATGNCSDIDGPLPPPSPELVKLYPNVR